MRHIERRLISCLTFIIANISLVAQDIEATLVLAERSLQERRYEHAGELYRRVIFFDKAAEYDAASVQGLAVSSFYLQDYDQAAKYFLILHRNSGKPSPYFYYILSLLNQDKVMEAKRAALNITDTTISLTTSKNIFLGLVEFRLADFAAADRYLSKANALIMESEESLADVLARARRIDRKNKLAAVFMSGLLPGLGQAYSGHYKEGVNSFALMAVFGTVYVYSIANFGPVDALISILPWFHRYYVGGMNSAAALVDDYKVDHWDDLYNEIVEIYAEHID